MIDRIAQSAFFRSLEAFRSGSLTVIFSGHERHLGDAASELQALVQIHNPRFFRRAVLGADMGMAESWMDGDWSSPDLTKVVQVASRNLSTLESANSFISFASRMSDLVRHRFRHNSVEGSRKNIREHYDLSNDFFRLFLDERMVYSCGWYETAHDSLETAQIQKLDRACRKLQLTASDHLLEIGTGWGAMAIHAAAKYGCRVTTTTISREQHDYAREQIARAGLSDRITLLLEDYRHLQGTFDRIVSIEMFEAVGFEYYDTFFGACDRLLNSDGAMLMQAITIDDAKFEAYRQSSDFIRKHIFPGSELGSVTGICASLARATRLALFHTEDMGTHYARTLAEWRRRFEASLPQVRQLGFDERFIRMWIYYLCYCEGAFLERHISDIQFLFTKASARRTLLHEPWAGDAALTLSLQSKAES